MIVRNDLFEYLVDIFHYNTHIIVLALLEYGLISIQFHKNVSQNYN